MALTSWYIITDQCSPQQVAFQGFPDMIYVCIYVMITAIMQFHVLVHVDESNLAIIIHGLLPSLYALFINNKWL